MVDINENSVYFTDGVIVSDEAVFISAKLNDASEADFSRVFYLKNGEWEVYEVDESIKSVSFYSKERLAFWMGKKGKIYNIGSGSIVETTIFDVSRYGFLNRMKEIGSSLYVCGYAGQIYKLEDGSWRHFDIGVLEEDSDAYSVDLQDIDGERDDIYVVGTGGALYHFDGRSWGTVDIPTNRHLLGVCYVSRDEVYISGTGGTLFVGKHDAWRNISYEGFNGDFWGVKYFKGNLYLAHAVGLVKWDKIAFEEIDFGINRVVTCHRLDANENLLWSFGIDDLFVFNGEQWNEVICPDNDPSQY